MRRDMKKLQEKVFLILARITGEMLLSLDIEESIYKGNILP